MVGDPSSWGLTLSVNGVPTTWSDSTFIEDAFGFGVGIFAETRASMPLHLGFDVDFALTDLSHYVIYVGGSFGYNHNLGNGLYLQGKLGLGYAYSYKEIAQLGKKDDEYGWYIFGDPREMFGPTVNITTSYFMLRPEVNAFFRVASNFLLTAGIGYQFPVWNTDLMLTFGGYEYNTTTGADDYFEINVRPTNNFRLGDKRGTEATTTASPQGFIINVGIAYDI
jgi:hypothetical protein